MGVIYFFGEILKSMQNNEENVLFVKVIVKNISTNR